MDRADYFKKVNEMKKLANELENYLTKQNNDFVFGGNTNHDLSSTIQYAKIAVAESTMHQIGTMLAFHANI